MPGRFNSTRLYYVRSRWYDPATGRFVSEDPIGISGGYNLYAFAGNDPITAWDPSGLYHCLPGIEGHTGVSVQINGNWWCNTFIGQLPTVVVTAPEFLDPTAPIPGEQMPGTGPDFGPGGGNGSTECSGARAHAAIEGGIDLALGVAKVGLGVFFAPETGGASLYVAWGGLTNLVSGGAELYGAASGHLAGAEKVANLAGSFSTVSGAVTWLATGNARYGATASSLETVALAAVGGGLAAAGPVEMEAASDPFEVTDRVDNVIAAADIVGVGACH